MIDYKRIKGLFSTLKFDTVIDTIDRKHNIIKNNIVIDDKAYTVGNDSILSLHSGQRFYFMRFENNVNLEYYEVELSNGDVIHYDLYGKSYMSLIPTSPLYKRRLSLYDIKKVI